MDLDLGPVFLPTITAYNIAESYHRIDMLIGSMPSGAFQTYFHHQFVAAFHDPAANRPAICLKAGVLDLLLPFFAR